MAQPLSARLGTWRSTALRCNPSQEKFDVTGKLEGREGFAVTLTLVSAKATAVSFRATGKLGEARLRAAAQLSLPATATGSADLSFTGTLGGTAISGNVPLPVDTTDHVAGSIKVG
jgi:hypothetical protein